MRGTHLAHLKHIWEAGNLNYGITEICCIFQTYHDSNFPLLKYASNMPSVCHAAWRSLRNGGILNPALLSRSPFALTPSLTSRKVIRMSQISLFTNYHSKPITFRQKLPDWFCFWCALLSRTCSYYLADEHKAFRNPFDWHEKFT